MMVRMYIPEYDIRVFTWMKTNGEWLGSTDVSDLKSLGLVWTRVYDDACDVGFMVRSPTGARKLFTLVSEKKDAEGDVLYWEFVSNVGLVIRVHND